MLVDEILAQVRVQLDEDETSDISDAVILQALNRGQVKLVRLATRHCPDLFRRETEVTADTRETDIPEASFGFAITEVDVLQGRQWIQLRAAQLRQLTNLDNEARTSVPSYFALSGSKLKIFPIPATKTVRLRYQFRPPALVLSQGRVTTLASASSVNIDALGSDLTTSIAQLKAFVNVVDATTGLVKATLQVAALDTTLNLVTFKTTGLDRTQVFGQTVATALPADLELDDYLAVANGTCVPTLTTDYADYLVQFAVVELKRKSGEPAPEDFAALKELEDDVKTMWAARPAQLRVEHKSPYWGSNTSLLQKYRG